MIGTRLRDLRTSRGLSLRDLGAATGLSATLLSQIERGVTEPSLKSLRRLADYFGQSVSTLFQEEPTMDTAHVTRPGQRRTLPAAHGQVRYERITRGNGRLEVLQGTLQPGECSSDRPRSHDAVECAYVLSGRLTVEVDGQVYVLTPGEAITVNSMRPHRYLNETEGSTDFILAVTPPTP